MVQINTGEAGVSGVDTAPMHAALLEFNHSYAAAMTAEAYARCTLHRLLNCALSHWLL
jgi:hypothetical protein